MNTGDITTPCIWAAVRQIEFAVFEKGNSKYQVINNPGVKRVNRNADSKSKLIETLQKEDATNKERNFYIHHHQYYFYAAILCKV